MSIRYVLGEWVRSGDVRLVEPALNFVPSARCVFAVEDVWLQLNGPWDDDRTAVRMSRARNYIDTFTPGDKISVRMPPSKSIHAFMAQLEEAEHEVWEIRVRDPNPQTRIFGRFIEPDVFFATSIVPRDAIDFPYEIGQCKRVWNTYFPTFVPYQGTSCDDYVSNCFPI